MAGLSSSTAAGWATADVGDDKEFRSKCELCDDEYSTHRLRSFHLVGRLVSFSLSLLLEAEQKTRLLMMM